MPGWYDGSTDYGLGRHYVQFGIQAEMGGTAMTTILKKIDSAVGEGGKVIRFSSCRREFKEFAKAWGRSDCARLVCTRFR